MGLVKTRLMKKTMTILCLMAAAAAGARGAELGYWPRAF